MNRNFDCGQLRSTVSFGVSILFAMLVIALFPELRAMVSEMASDPNFTSIFYGLMAFILVINFLAIRLGFGLGVKNGMKLQQSKETASE